MTISSFEISPTRFLLGILTQRENVFILSMVAILNDKFHLVTQQELSTSAEIVAKECKISHTADYIVVLYQAPEEKQCIEVFTLQADAWFRNIESLVFSNASQQSPMPSQIGENENSEQPSQSMAVDAEDAVTSDHDRDKNKFQSCHLHLRFKYPTMNASPSLQQFIKASDSNDGICLGTNHLLTNNYLSMRQKLHDARQARLMPMATESLIESLAEPKTLYKHAPRFAWLSDSKFAVSWDDVSSLTIYSTIKPPPSPTKGMISQPNLSAEQQEGRVESSWPLSSPALSLSVSRSGQLLVVLLESGKIMILNTGDFPTGMLTVHAWVLSASYSILPTPLSSERLLTLDDGYIFLKTNEVTPASALNYASLLKYDRTEAKVCTCWKFNSLDIASDFYFVEIFEQWPTVLFIGLPDGVLLLCDRNEYKKKLTQLRLPPGYVWPSQSKHNRPTLYLTADGKILLAEAHYESLIISSQESTENNKLFRFDLVSNLPADLICRWNSTAIKAQYQSHQPKSTLTSIANTFLKQCVCSSSDTAERLKQLWTEERDKTKDSRD